MLSAGVCKAWEPTICLSHLFHPQFLCPVIIKLVCRPAAGVHAPTCDLHLRSWLQNLLQVWWADDAAWYTGSVTRFDATEAKHLVEYDDGDEELVDFATEKYEILPGERLIECPVTLFRGPSPVHEALEEFSHLPAYQ